MDISIGECAGTVPAGGFEMAEENQDRMTLAEFVLGVGLYDRVNLTSCPDFLDLYGQNTRGIFHAYCVDCEGATTFSVDEGNSVQDRLYEEQFFSQHRFHFANFSCRRNPDHHLAVVSLLQDGMVQKIGQFPSTADLKFSEMKFEMNNLDKSDRREFATGIGLLSHGVGIGSYVYFRRILERQVQSVFEEHKDEKGWVEEDFKRMRMGERVRHVEEFLPDFFAEHPVLYSVLSKGIHELDEDTCLAHSPVLQAALEIILEEIVASRAKKKRRAEVAAQVKKLKLP